MKVNLDIKKDYPLRGLNSMPGDNVLSFKDALDKRKGRLEQSKISTTPVGIFDENFLPISGWPSMDSAEFSLYHESSS